MITKTTVSASMVRILLRFFKAKGVDTDSILKSINLAPSLFEDCEARIASRYYEALWSAAVKQSGDPFIGLHFGRDMAGHYPGGNVLFALMMNCSTVGLALDKFIHYHRIMADAIQPKLRITNNKVYLAWEVFEPGYVPQPYISETLLCTFHTLLQHITEGKLLPVQVRFTHPRPNDVSEYQKVFQAPVKFNAGQNELVIERASLDLPIQLANKQFLQVMEQYAAKLLDRMGAMEVWSDKVARQIGKMIIKGRNPKIDAVAGELVLSKRNLQVKLKQEGTSFRQIGEDVRKEIAKDYLKRADTTICDVAFLLGYSEQSVFNHAFKRWTGKTPKEYRINC